MGESVSEATIIKWLKQPGDPVEEDEAVLEIATDKVDSEVPSPVSGVLREQLFSEDTVVQVGQVLAVIETESAEVDSGEATPGESRTLAADSVAQAPSAEPAVPYVPSPVGGDAAPLADRQTAHVPAASEQGERFYSPLVKSIAAQEGISREELDRIPGTGSENRVTKQDVLDYLQRRTTADGQADKVHAPAAQSSESPGREAIASSRQQVVPPTPPPATAPVVPSGSDEILEMDRMRRLISDHMVNSVHTSPHVTSFVEADVTNLVHWRNKVKSAYEKREGEKITFTPIFIEAVSKAIRDFPMINVSVDGYRIIKKKNINIGMATALPSGNLIVPVIKNADQLSLVGISKAVNDLATRARANKLRPDDTQGGTFTLTNIGAFGNIMGTPIINQPQVAILAVGTIVKKPAVVETEFGDMIGIRHKMYLSLSYDHRVVDGALGGQFVKRVADYLEAWDPNREI